MDLKKLAVILAEVGEGAPDGGCKFGGAALRDLGLVRRLQTDGRAVAGLHAVTADPLRAHGRTDVVETFNEALAAAVASSMARGEQPLVVGGDHSCAMGTWSAVATALRPRGRLGLVWIDAHMDAHTPETSDTQAPHGMPVATLLGHGRPRMTDLLGWRGKLLPQHLVIIGARSYEPGEAALMEQLGVRVMDMQEVAQRGFGACYDEAVDLVTTGTAGWGISFDVDGLDPLDAPGTGTPVPAGIWLDEAVEALAGCHADERFVAFELAEYNPLRDYGGHTGRALLRLLSAALAPQWQRADLRPASAGCLIG